MRMTAVHAQTERKRQEWSARHVSAVLSIKTAAQGEERLSSVQNQAILTSYDRPLGERWFTLQSLSIQLAS